MHSIQFKAETKWIFKLVDWKLHCSLADIYRNERRAANDTKKWIAIWMIKAISIEATTKTNKNAMGNYAEKNTNNAEL